jgi:hypothetical protein
MVQNMKLKSSLGWKKNNVGAEYFGVHERTIAHNFPYWSSLFIIIVLMLFAFFSVSEKSAIEFIYQYTGDILPGKGHHYHQRTPSPQKKCTRHTA